MDSSCEWTHMIGMRRIAMKGFDSVAVCSRSCSRCWNETFLIAALSLDWTVRNEIYTDINENSCIPRNNQSIKINIIFHFYTQNNNFHEISAESWICTEFWICNQMKLNKRWFDFQFLPFFHSLLMRIQFRIAIYSIIFRFKYWFYKYFTISILICAFSEKNIVFWYKFNFWIQFPITQL